VPQENDIPVVVFNLNKEGNIVSALRGNQVGTCVSSQVDSFRNILEVTEKTATEKTKGEQSV
jgi:hypothetical protein